MTQQRAMEFFAHVEQNPTLKQNIKALASKEELLNLAQESGYSFSVDDFKAISQESELNEQELEAVAGGGLSAIWREIKKTANDVWEALK